VYITEVAQMSL